MPRRVKPGPPILRIEGLSTGHEVFEKPEVELDDWTGEPIVPVERKDTRPARELPSAQDIQDQRNRDKARAQRLLIEATMPHLVTWTPEPRPEAKPRLAHNQTLIKVDGQDHVVTMAKPIPPWRRM